MRQWVKRVIKDTPVEPYLRWLVKRTRGIKIPYNLVKNEIYDRQTAEVMERVLHYSSSAVDVGCHKGEFLRLFLKLAPHGHHYAFEPIPQLANALQEEFRSAHVFNYALCDKSGDATFYVIPERPALSGLNERAFKAKGNRRVAIMVKTERLDAVIPEDEKIALIKIDVEGAEGLVIAGAINIIKRNKPYIVFEHGDSSLKAFGISSAEIYEMLVEQCGLRISLLKNWLSGGDPLSKAEFMKNYEWYFLAHPARHEQA